MHYQYQYYTAINSFFLMSIIMDVDVTTSRTSLTILPSIKSSHFTLAETDLIENLENDAVEQEQEQEEEELLEDQEEKAQQVTKRKQVQLKRPNVPAAPSDTDSLIEYLQTNYNRDRKVFLILFCAVSMITIILLSLIVYILTFWLRGFSFHPDSSSDDDYNIHLIVMIIGSLLLPAYGMLIFRVFPHVPYATLVNYHIAIHVTGLLLSVFGIKVAYDAHHLYAKTHLYSLHSWFGFTIFILQFVELITGNWLYFRSFPQPIMKYCHMLAGTIIFIWSGAAASSGLMYRATLLLKQADGKMDKVTQFTLNGFGVLATLFAILVRYLCSDYRFRRRNLPEKTSDFKSTILTDADPFTQDTFEYGTARKSIFVGADTTEELGKVITPQNGSSSSEIVEQFDDEGDSGGRGVGTSLFYGASLRRNTITRRSIVQELTKLNRRRSENLSKENLSSSGESKIAITSVTSNTSTTKASSQIQIMGQPQQKHIE